MKMLTSGEVSELLRVSRPTVWAMLRRGELVGFRRGRLTRVTEESVRQLLSEGSTDGERPGDPAPPDSGRAA